MNNINNSNLPVPQKNRGGRPKGKKDSTKRLSPYMKAQARALYIGGHLPEDIAKAIGFDDPVVIKTVAKRENWDVDRDMQMQAASSEILNEVVQQQRESFAGLKTIREKAIDAIRKSTVQPTRYSEAANAYISSLELEYRIRVEALQVTFLNDVAVVLRNEIQDKDLLARIAAKLRVVFEKYQQRQLPEAKQVDKDAN